MILELPSIQKDSNSRFTVLKNNLFCIVSKVEVKNKWVIEVVVLAQEQCTKQSALIAEKNVKFPLNLKKDAPSIAEIAIQSTGNIDRKFF
jgi:formylmethanofuran dehydrogenase subunit E-like metal-binding protein